MTEDAFFDIYKAVKAKTEPQTRQTSRHTGRLRRTAGVGATINQSAALVFEKCRVAIIIPNGALAPPEQFRTAVRTAFYPHRDGCSRLQFETREGEGRIRLIAQGPSGQVLGPALIF